MQWACHLARRITYTYHEHRYLCHERELSRLSELWTSWECSLQTLQGPCLCVAVFEVILFPLSLHCTIPSLPRCPGGCTGRRLSRKLLGVAVVEGHPSPRNREGADSRADPTDAVGEGSCDQLHWWHSHDTSNGSISCGLQWIWQHWHGKKVRWQSLLDCCSLWLHSFSFSLSLSLSLSLILFLSLSLSLSLSLHCLFYPFYPSLTS